jgi:hypothetical protein
MNGGRTMKRIFLTAVAALLFCAGKAQAAGGQTPVFTVGYSTGAWVGIRCSTGAVAAQFNISRPAGLAANIAGYRIVNQDTSAAVWIGGPSVSTGTALNESLTNLGEKVAAGGSLDLPFGRNYLGSGAPLLPIYCKGADAAGPGGVIISVRWNGY